MKDSEVEVVLSWPSGTTKPEGASDFLKVPADKIGAALSSYCRDLAKSMAEMPSEVAPNEFAIEFGVTGAGKTKLLIVEGSVTGHFKVTASWRR